MELTPAARTCGSVKPGFEAVRGAFVTNFENGAELGAACSVYYRGAKVVDLWGGIRNAATGEPWEEDTMVIVYSTTKGMAGLAMALAHSRGLFDYDERVSTYWPEFAKSAPGRTGRGRLCGVRIPGRWSLPGLTPAPLGATEPVEKYGAGTCGTVDCCHEREYQTHHGRAPPGDVNW